ncbi:hypothetical protein [Nonlabens ulvanivorans]|uniref:Lipoprotein n=1 Tax=Nonlabens ulvanivorans TaxID=906888 RepID=A0A084JYW7_NONUL|nr:hypothetical protein [Nonlabens ulvanivorans]KEZ94151.1 hypothetical protein IL45_03105 [Nonlabens ulvanivorans]PRX13140.1 hypothetical protein LY02_02200 [Nonlabens ulvanivorans]
MKNIGHYFFIALGASCVIFAIYKLLKGDYSSGPIAGPIVGLALIKISLDKIKLQKEAEKNK